MRVISSAYWLYSRIRIYKTAIRMRDRFGDGAFIVARRRYWSAISSGGPRRRAFWRELSEEIGSQIRRRDVIREALRGAGGDPRTDRTPFTPMQDSTFASSSAGQPAPRVFGKRVEGVSGA